MKEQETMIQKQFAKRVVGRRREEGAKEYRRKGEEGRTVRGSFRLRGIADKNTGKGGEKTTHTIVRFHYWIYGVGERK